MKNVHRVSTTQLRMYLESVKVKLSPQARERNRFGRFLGCNGKTWTNVKQWDVSLCKTHYNTK